MKFLPILDIWQPGVALALYNGQLKLQKGQWVRCGENARPSRFVCRRGAHSLWVAHPEGDKGTSESFRRLCSIA